ncbi:MAG: hypothetical protein KAT05_06355 [Spirochaetes bacterium]|nr:hypothetical protein [Spirochaetota bacterium]
MTIKRKTVTKMNEKEVLLEDRDDLFEKWVIGSWFFNKDWIKKAYFKKVFFELFMSLYDDLSSKFSAKKRDEIFGNFINVVFPTVLDVYKWHESEKEEQDIGLIKALEDISLRDWYIDLLTSYSRQYNKTKKR